MARWSAIRDRALLLPVRRRSRGKANFSRSSAVLPAAQVSPSPCLFSPADPLLPRVRAPPGASASPTPAPISPLARLPAPHRTPAASRGTRSLDLGMNPQQEDPRENPEKLKLTKVLTEAVKCAQALKTDELIADTRVKEAFAELVNEVYPRLPESLQDQLLVDFKLNILRRAQEKNTPPAELMDGGNEYLHMGIQLLWTRTTTIFQRSTRMGSALVACRIRMAGEVVM
uniref:Uncharacterized protein n=1 Tax=Triticum urartu TaxID=4572 RepID=A0A8R7PLZ6_TRIUA